MTAAPSIDTLPIAMFAPTADEYGVKPGDVVQFAYVGNAAWLLVGTVVKVLTYGVVVVELPSRARFKVRVDECTILLTREAAEWGERR